MDYATLGPSELQPSLFDGYAFALLQRSLSQSKAGQVSVIIFPSVQFAMTCVFIKQSLIPILCWHASTLQHYHVTPSSEVTVLICRVP